jgi:plasmid stabilization system protein ParE
MAYRVIWSVKAIEDVDTIAAYIARDSPSYAAAMVQEILTTTRSLHQEADTGKLVPELGEDNIKEKAVYSYRIIYRIEAEIVTIAALIHQKKLLETS